VALIHLTMKKTIFCGLFLLGSTSFWAQQKITYEAYDLPNGLHVILHEEHATPIVAVSVLYHVGSKNENPNRTGFAHFFEHLLFEGSANIGRGEYSELVEKNGGTLNANTSQDRTYYYEVLPSNQLKIRALAREVSACSTPKSTSKASRRNAAWSKKKDSA